MDKYWWRIISLLGLIIVGIIICVGTVDSRNHQPIVIGGHWAEYEEEMYSDKGGPVQVGTEWVTEYDWSSVSWFTRAYHDWKVVFYIGAGVFFVGMLISWRQEDGEE